MLALLAGEEFTQPASGDGNGDGRKKASRGPAPVDDLAHGAGGHRIALERLDEPGGTDRILDLEPTLRSIADVWGALGRDP